jgi:hypothetical protein
MLFNIRRSRMKKYVVAAVVALSLGVVAAPAFAATETVTGKVVSLSCYFQTQKNAGVPEAVCYHATIKYEANPVGIVTTDGKVYQLAGGVLGVNNAKIYPFAGKNVTVTGEVSEKAGMTMLTSDDVKSAP